MTDIPTKTPTEILADNPAQTLDGTEPMIGDQNGTTVGIIPQQIADLTLLQVPPSISVDTIRPAILEFSSQSLLVDITVASLNFVTSGATKFYVAVDNPVVVPPLQFVVIKPTTIDLLTTGFHKIYAWCQNAVTQDISQFAVWDIEVRLSSPTTLDSISVTNPPVDTTTANITWAITGTEGNTEYAVGVNDNTSPVYSPTKPTTVDLSTGNGGIVGINTVYAWIRDITSLVVSGPVNTNSLVTQSGNSVISLFATVDSVSEERSPVYNIVCNLSGIEASDVTFTLVASGASKSHTPVSQVATIVAGLQTVSIPMQIVYAALTADDTIAIQISSASANATIDQNANVLILTVQSIKDYFSVPSSPAGSADGDVDWNTMDELTLPQVTTNFNQTGGTVTDGFKHYVGASMSAGSSAFRCFNVTDATIKNILVTDAPRGGFYIDGGTNLVLQNCKVRTSNTDNDPTLSPGSTVINNGTGTIREVGNWYDDCDTGTYWWGLTGMVDKEYAHNYITLIKRRSSQVSHGWQVGVSGDIGSTRVHDNIAFDRSRTSIADTFNVYKSGGLDANNPFLFYDNYSFVDTTDRTASACILTDTGGAGDTGRLQFTEAYRMTSIDNAGSGAGLTGGTVIYRDFDIFCSAISAPTKDNSNGVVVRRQNANVLPGQEFFDCEFSGAKVLNYRDQNNTGVIVESPFDARSTVSYKELDLQENCINHGPAGGGGSCNSPYQQPIGWGTNNFSYTMWDNVGSEGPRTYGYDDLFWNRRRVTRWPLNITGFDILYAYQEQGSENIGDGTLNFTAAGNMFTWQEYGDTAGTAVTGSSLLAHKDILVLNSGNGNRLHLRRNTDPLPLADVFDDDITISSVPLSQWVYSGSDGSGNMAAGVPKIGSINAFDSFSRTGNLASFPVMDTGQTWQVDTAFFDLDGTSLIPNAAFKRIIFESSQQKKVIEVAFRMNLATSGNQSITIINRSNSFNDEWRATLIVRSSDNANASIYFERLINGLITKGPEVTFPLDVTTQKVLRLEDDGFTQTLYETGNYNPKNDSTFVNTQHVYFNYDPLNTDPLDVNRALRADPNYLNIKSQVGLRSGALTDGSEIILNIDADNSAVPEQVVDYEGQWLEALDADPISRGGNTGLWTPDFFATDNARVINLRMHWIDIEKQANIYTWTDLDAELQALSDQYAATGELYRLNVLLGSRIFFKNEYPMPPDMQPASLSDADLTASYAAAVDGYGTIGDNGWVVKLWKDVALPNAPAQRYINIIVAMSNRYKDNIHFQGVMTSETSLGINIADGNQTDLANYLGTDYQEYYKKVIGLSYPTFKQNGHTFSFFVNFFTSGTAADQALLGGNQDNGTTGVGDALINTDNLMHYITNDPAYTGAYDYGSPTDMTDVVRVGGPDVLLRHDKAVGLYNRVYMIYALHHLNIKMFNSAERDSYQDTKTTSPFDTSTLQEIFTVATNAIQTPNQLPPLVDGTAALQPERPFSLRTFIWKRNPAGVTRTWAEAQAVMKANPVVKVDNP